MTAVDFAILFSTIICVAGLICATIKRSKYKGCGGCENCPCKNGECPCSKKKK